MSKIVLSFNNQKRWSVVQTRKYGKRSRVFAYVTIELTRLATKTSF
ncbi:MAG TPA: hypothetical protein VJ201_00765 [Candidatus Babeliales bacterium]|nr:hypothetical protein [Candidatus Babeliales bacterium]